MKVLVTGGSGFIGEYVCRKLRFDNHEVVVYDHFDHGVPRQWQTHLGDVRDRVSVTEAVAHVDGVIHLAAVLGSAETVANPMPAIHTNIFGAVNVMEACVQYDIPMTMTTVGNGWMRSDGAGTYTIVKECAADLAQMYRNYRDLRCNVVRPMNAYGPGQKAPHPWGTSKVRKIMPSFICRALSGLPVQVYGDGEQISDMVYVEDVADLMIQAMEHADQGLLHPIAEIGPAESMTVQQLATAVVVEAANYTGRSCGIENIPMRDGEKPGVTAADHSTLAPYNIKLTPFDVGLADTMYHYYQQLQAREQ